MAVLTGIRAFGSELLGKELLPASSELITLPGKLSHGSDRAQMFLGTITWTLGAMEPQLL